MRSRWEEVEADGVPQLQTFQVLKCFTRAGGAGAARWPSRLGGCLRACAPRTPRTLRGGGRLGGSTDAAPVMGEPSARGVASLGVRAPPGMASGCALGSRRYIAGSALDSRRCVSSVRIDMQPVRGGDCLVLPSCPRVPVPPASPHLGMLFCRTHAEGARASARSECLQAGGRQKWALPSSGGWRYRLVHRIHGKAEDPAEQAGGHRARLGDRSPEPGSPLPARCSHVRCSCCLWRDRASYGRCLRVTFPETAASGRGFDWASLGRVPKLLW